MTETVVIEWLLDSDPAIRWQVMRDLTDQAPGVVAAERARVATEGWGAQLLALQAPDGLWAGKAWSHDWTDTFHVLELLRRLGLDPASGDARRAIGLVREHVTWGDGSPWENPWGDNAFFEGEVENGATVSSFATTINVVEGLLAYEQATGGSDRVGEARRRGDEYMLERRLFRRKSTGEVIDPSWLQFSFPHWYFYDVLRALDYFRAADARPDAQVAEAIAAVETNRAPDGRWPLQNVHPGASPVELDAGEGRPSRWNTLRAMRVLQWANPPGQSAVQ